MERIITIEEGRSYNFKASAFSPIQYNKLFPGRDFLRDIESLYKVQKELQEENSISMETYETFVRVAYTFAYQGMSPTPAQTPEQKEFREKYPGPWEWIDTFGTFSIYQTLPAIVELWYGGEITTATAKKNSRKPSVK